MYAKPISGADGSWVRACGIDALVGRAMVPVFVAGRHILLVQDEGQLFATERACPHERADLAAGRCAEGRLFCPRHQAWFALQDGSVSPGWNFRGLRTYPVRMSGANICILIDLVRTPDV